MISDKVYDGLFDDLKRREHLREESTGMPADPDSPTQMIWGDMDWQYPDWAKVRKEMEACTE